MHVFWHKDIMDNKSETYASIIRIKIPFKMMLLLLQKVNLGQLRKMEMGNFVRFYGKKYHSVHNVILNNEEVNWVVL